MGFDGGFFADTLKFLKSKLPEQLYRRIVMNDVDRMPTTVTDAPAVGLYTPNEFRHWALGRVQTLLIDGTNLLFNMVETQLRVDEATALDMSLVANRFYDELERIWLARARSLRVIAVAFDRSDLVPIQKWAEWDKRDESAHRAGISPLRSRRLVSFYGHPRLSEAMRDRPTRDLVTREIVDRLADVIANRSSPYYIVLDANADGSRYLYNPDYDTIEEWDPDEVPPAQGEGDISLLALYRLLKSNRALARYTNTVEWYVNDSDFLAIALSTIDDVDAFNAQATDPAKPPMGPDGVLNIGMHLVHLINNRAPPSPLIDVYLWAHFLLRNKYAATLFRLLFTAYLAGSDFVHYRPPTYGYLRLRAAQAQVPSLPAATAADEETPDNAFAYVRALFTKLDAYAQLNRSKATEAIPRPPSGHAAPTKSWSEYRQREWAAVWRCDSVEEFERQLRITSNQALWQWHYFRQRNRALIDAPELVNTWNVHNYARTVRDVGELALVQTQTPAPPAPAFVLPPPVRTGFFRHTLRVFRLFSIRNTSRRRIFDYERYVDLLAPYLEPVRDTATGEWHAQWKADCYPVFERGVEHMLDAYRHVVRTYMLRYGYMEFDWRESNKPYVELPIVPDFYPRVGSTLWTNEQRLWYALWNETDRADVHMALIRKRLVAIDSDDALASFFFLRNGTIFPLKSDCGRLLDGPILTTSTVYPLIERHREVPMIPYVHYLFSGDDTTSQLPYAIEFLGRHWTRASAGRVLLAFFFQKSGKKLRAWGRRCVEEDICYLHEVDPARTARADDWEGDALMLAFYSPEKTLDDVVSVCDMTNRIVKLKINTTTPYSPGASSYAGTSSAGSSAGGSSAISSTGSRILDANILVNASDMTLDEIAFTRSSPDVPVQLFDGGEVNVLDVIMEDRRQAGIQRRRSSREADEEGELAAMLGELTAVAAKEHAGDDEPSSGEEEEEVIETDANGVQTVKRIQRTVVRRRPQRMEEPTSLVDDIVLTAANAARKEKETEDRLDDILNALVDEENEMFGAPDEDEWVDVNAPRAIYATLDVAAVQAAKAAAEAAKAAAAGKVVATTEGTVLTLPPSVAVSIAAPGTPLGKNQPPPAAGAGSLSSGPGSGSSNTYRADDDDSFIDNKDISDELAVAQSPLSDDTDIEQREFTLVSKSQRRERERRENEVLGALQFIRRVQGIAAATPDIAASPPNRPSAETPTPAPAPRRRRRRGLTRNARTAADDIDDAFFGLSS